MRGRVRGAGRGAACCSCRSAVRSDQDTEISAQHTRAARRRPRRRPCATYGIPSAARLAVGVEARAAESSGIRHEHQQVGHGTARYAASQAGCRTSAHSKSISRQPSASEQVVVGAGVGGAERVVLGIGSAAPPAPRRRAGRSRPSRSALAAQSRVATSRCRVTPGWKRSTRTQARDGRLGVERRPGAWPPGRRACGRAARPSARAQARGRRRPRRVGAEQSGRRRSGPSRGPPSRPAAARRRRPAGGARDRASRRRRARRARGPRSSRLPRRTT